MRCLSIPWLPRASYSLVPIYTPEWREAQLEHNTLFPARAQTKALFTPTQFHFCNRIGLDGVTPLVYMAPVELVIRTGSFFKTLSKVERFQNDTVSLVV